MSDKKKYILSLDHGTSGMKTALISTKGDIQGFDVAEYPVYYFEQGCAEQKPSEWWHALEKTVHNLIDKNLVAVEDIVAVVSSNQMSGTVPIAQDGETLQLAH